MTNPTPNQPSSAVDELRASAFNDPRMNIGGLTAQAVPLSDAERIIAAQEQRLDWTRQERDKYDLMSIKLCEERDALQEKVEQQEQRLGELESQHAAWLIERAELTALATGLEAERDAYLLALAKATGSTTPPPYAALDCEPQHEI